MSPEFRSAGLGRLLFEYVASYAPTLPGSEIYFGEAVCNHTHSQKAGALIQTIETGIEVDLLPGEVYTKYQKISGRVAVVNMLGPTCPNTIPSICQRSMKISSALSTPVLMTAARSKSRREARPQSRRPASPPEYSRPPALPALASSRRAPISSAAFAAETSAVINQEGIRVIQVWLNWSHQGLSPIVDALRKRGFFFWRPFPPMVR